MHNISSLIRHIIPEQFRPIGYLTHLTQARTNCTVRSGAFKDLKYVERSVGSAYIPKLLGIYERELFPVIEIICQHEPRLIIDIGAAEGYYAVGLAKRNPQAKVIAFEMNETGRAALHKMAALNGIRENLDIRAKCELADLDSALQQSVSPIIICDVEGYEEVLLDPNKIPALKKASILVETHDFIIPEITSELQSRFQPSHNIRTIWQEERHLEDFPWRTISTHLLPQRYLMWAVSEWRPVKMSWLWMQPYE